MAAAPLLYSRACLCPPSAAASPHAAEEDLRAVWSPPTQPAPAPGRGENESIDLPPEALHPPLRTDWEEKPRPVFLSSSQ